MTVSDDTLQSMSPDALDSLAERAKKMASAKRRQLNLENSLTDMVLRVVKDVEMELAKPNKKQNTIVDLPVTLDGYYRVEEVLATPGYAEAVKALREKLGLPVEIYQGTTTSSVMRETDHHSDARIRVFLKGNESSAGETTLEILKEIGKV